MAAVTMIGLGIGGALGSVSTAIKPDASVKMTPQAALASPTPTPAAVMETATPATLEVAQAAPTPTPAPTVTPTPPPLPFEETFTYGYSVENRPLQGFRLGTGESARFIIGAIHGGYEWNTVEVVSKTLEYYREHREELPVNVALYLIPLANPDGYAAGRDAIVGRMNAHSVDLNRNWDYRWQMTATHGTRPVSAGAGPFSEPETAALRDVLLEKRPDAVIFYHSAMGVVFSGADRERSFTYELTESIAAATGYRHQTEGIPGQITTGDAIDWLSTVGIAGTEIELTTHASISEAEWLRNLKGIRAFLEWRVPQSTVVDDGSPENGSLPADAPAGYKWYTIPDGTTLLDIVFSVCEGSIELDELVRLNKIANPDMVPAGMRILIPESCQ
ncbi:MAG: hypothetical protein JW892_15965 [Anaerolineae bacterium]|nr:hypothetical protein [Anaerolineae bacterium]